MILPRFAVCLWFCAAGFCAIDAYAADRSPALPAGSESAVAATERETRFDPVVRQIHGWTVDVDPQLLAGEHAASGARALEMLAGHLQRIAILIPEDRLAKLRQIGIWIEWNHPVLRNLAYHPSRDWLAAHGHDPRLARKVHITRATQLLEKHELLKHPAVILHELAHGYHDQFLGFNDARILAAYEKAKAAGIYENVLLFNGRRVSHYALTNHKEYFAEGTEAFFYRNDFYPFVRAELKLHDPALHDLLADIWGEQKRRQSQRPIIANTNRE